MRKICENALVLVVCVSIVIGAGFVQKVQAALPCCGYVVVQPFGESDKNCD